MSDSLITVKKTEDGRIEVSIANVPLAKKIDILAAITGAVREAHGDTMTPKAWAAMHRAQEALADAMMSLNTPGLFELPDAVKRLRVK